MWVKNTAFVFTDLKFLNLIGKTKEEIMFLVGNQFDDIHSDIWMHRSYYRISFLMKVVSNMV